MQLEHILQTHGIIGRGKGEASIPLPEVTNFTGASDSEGTKITLSWANPPIVEFNKTQIFMSDADISNVDYDTLEATGNKIVNEDVETFTIEGLSHNDTRHFKAFTVINTLGEIKVSRGTSLTATVRDIQAPGVVTGVTIKEDSNKLDITLTNPTDTDFSHIIVRYGTSLIANENDGISGYQGNNQDFTITGLTNDTEYHIRIFTVDTAGNINRSTDMQYTGTPSDGDDKTGSPGSKNLIAGTMDAGYFGVVPASELFTGTQLSEAVGISQGIIQFDDTPWLKFALDGKILFRPMKAFRHSISWDTINAAGCVFGTKTVSKNGHTYKVRLMKGALTDPSKDGDSDRGAKGSEWNRLMLPIHIQAKDKNWAYPAYVEESVPYWGIDFTDKDLAVITVNGRVVWCQETPTSNPSGRVYRGYHGVSHAYWNTSSNAYANYGWAPCLEWVS